MCGICGYWSSNAQPETLQHMTESIRHRGPDSNGVFKFESVGLGHARLSILDLSSTGHQPMTASNGKTTIVFNGEVYNFQSLAHQLEQPLRGQSDTEVVLEAYCKWGPEILDSLEGMFAFAIWDAEKHELVLARDRFGIKPLYYWNNNGQLVFASEIKAILKHPNISQELDWQGFHEFLHYGTTLGETTMFRGIKRLLPGHQMVVNKTGTVIRKFADIHNVNPIRPSYEEATKKVRALLEEAVERHLVSDVPVGVFLSGGIDSACVTAFASRHYGGKLKTYTAAFDFEPEHNELESARFIADHFNTEHHELEIAAQNIIEDIETLVAHHDVPFGDIANLPLYLMCKELGQNTKVIMQGDGGDEIFGGYHRYARIQRDWIYRALNFPVSKFKRFLPRNSRSYRSLRTIEAFSKPIDEQMAWVMSHQQSEFPVTQILSRRAAKALDSTDPFAVYRKYFHKLRNLPPVQRMLYLDSAIILPDLYFEKVDRSTMARGIEIRVPMVDNRLTAYVMSLPWKYKVSGNDKKRILRDALRGIVPDRILDGPKKGLNVPFRKWLQGPLVSYLKQVLLDDETDSWDLFDRSEVEAAIARNTEGTGEHGFLLYKLMLFCIWYRTYKIQS